MAPVSSESRSIDGYESPIYSAQSSPRSIDHGMQRDFRVDSPYEQQYWNLEDAEPGQRAEQVKGALRTMHGKTARHEETKQADIEVHEPEYYERTGTPFPKFYKRYLETFGQKKGLEMYEHMMRWRAEHDVDHILEKPYPEFQRLKEGTPHFVYGRAKNGAFVSYELNGRIDPGKLSKAGVRAQDIEKHIAFCMEAVREGLDNGVERSYMVVMDLKGFSILKASNFFFLTITRTYGETLHKYYAGVLERLVVVNPPFGAKAIFKILMAVLPGAFGEKVEVVADPKALLQWIDADQLPVEYGGTNTTPLAESEVEHGINAILERANRT